MGCRRLGHPRRWRRWCAADNCRVHHTDRDHIGVADADVVRVTSAHGQLDLPVHADDTVPAGTAVLAWNLPDRAAATLVDHDRRGHRPAGGVRAMTSPGLPRFAF